MPSTTTSLLHAAAYNNWHIHFRFFLRPPSSSPWASSPLNILRKSSTSTLLSQFSVLNTTCSHHHDGRSSKSHCQSPSPSLRYVAVVSVSHRLYTNNLHKAVPSSLSVTSRDGPDSVLQSTTPGKEPCLASYISLDI